MPKCVVFSLRVGVEVEPHEVDVDRQETDGKQNDKRLDEQRQPEFPNVKPSEMKSKMYRNKYKGYKKDDVIDIEYITHRRKCGKIFTSTIFASLRRARF